MVQLRNTIAIDASQDEVWEVLGDLAATSEWLPGVVRAEVDGAKRVCTMADGSEIHEEISDYEPDQRSFRYRHLRVPMPVKDSGGSFSVEPAPNGGSNVLLESSFAALDPGQEEQVGQMIEGAFQQALESLKRRIEQGARWDAQ